MLCVRIRFIIIALFIQLINYSQTFKVDYFFGDNTVYSIEIINDKIWIGGYLGITLISHANFEDKELIINPFVDLNPDYCYCIFLSSDHNGKLYLHNGQSLLQYENESYSLIQSNLNISDFYIDKDNIIWILSGENEILKIKNNVVTRITSANLPLPGYQYSCLCAYDDNVWLGTYNNGIVKISNNAITEYNSNNSALPYDIVSSIAVNNGVLWAACHTYGVHPQYDTDYTLVKFYENNWEIYNKVNSGLPKTIINDIVPVENDIYLCSSDGLIKCDGFNWDITNIENSNILSDNVRTVKLYEGELWIGTEEGLSMITDDTTINIKLANTPISGVCQGPITQDLDGNIWIGSSGTFGNLCKFDGNNWSEVMPKGSISSPNSLYSLAVDTNNVVWATAYSYEGGLYRISGDSIMKFDEFNSVIPDFPQDVIVDKYNNKWITSDWKIIKYDDANWTVYDENDFEFLKLPRCIAADNDGNIWIGVHQSGMVKFDGESWTHFNDNFFGHEYSEVNKIVVDNQNNLWIDYSHGTIEPKLCKISGNNIEWYDENINLTEKERGLLAVDNNGDVWYGTRNGIAKYNGMEWSFYNSDNCRLLNNQVWEFYIDTQNNKWVSADCYIARFNEDSAYYQDFKFEQIHDPKFTVYPNPANEMLIHIRTNDIILTDIRLRIFDNTGNLIIEKYCYGKTDFDIDLANIPQGIYLIQFYENGETETHKIIKY
jgi:ligand-binding sensor domain-containing protein